jgi:Ser/Thr protein kinase RdoA (MazF antagonist)
MKQFTELTRLGRLRRLHGLADVALQGYGLGSTRSVLVRDAGNTLYRVHSSEIACRPDEDDLFVSGQFLLRAHWPGYRHPAAIQLELEWLRLLREKHGLPVPEPVAARNGELMVKVSCTGVPGSRYCSVLRWVKGRRVRERATTHHYAAQGRLMAGMHAVGEELQPSDRAALRSYDCDGLFIEVPALCLPVDDVWPLLPRRYVSSFREVSGRMRKAMQTLGDGRDVFGLIHADLGTDANLLFWHGNPRAIDFDESGLGYWVYDLAVAMEHCRGRQDFRLRRDALLDGYCEVRELPGEQIQHMDLFMAAFDVHLGLWANAVVRLRPELDVVRRRFERCARLVEAYLETGTQEGLEPPS